MVFVVMMLGMFAGPPTGVLPNTVAEKTGYTETATHREVIQFCEDLARERPDRVRLSELGTSVEGRGLPLILLADPPVQSPDDLKGRSVFFAMGNIHAGEVCGKEALLMLAREWADQPNPLFKNWVIALVPIFNADGNERIAPNEKNRPGQVGPIRMGIRYNAANLDLNRDFVKLESPEVRALARFVTKWNPLVAVDTHTTNGSYHRYTITFDSPRHPLTAEKLLLFGRDTYLRGITEVFDKKASWKTFFYGNFNQDKTRWEMFPPDLRYSTHYFGARHVLGILSEAYAYASFKERVLATKDFTHECLTQADKHQTTIKKFINEAKLAAASIATTAKPDFIPLRVEETPLGDNTSILGYEERRGEGDKIQLGAEKTYKLAHWGGTKVVKSVARPIAYFIPKQLTQVIHNLQRHGIAVEEVREDIQIDAETYRVTKIMRSARPFQGHNLIDLSVDPAVVTDYRMTAGGYLVKTNQPLGRLASYLLEPESSDGLVTWNFFDSLLREGQPFPVVRIAASEAKTLPPLPLSTSARPLPEDRRKPERITVDALLGRGTARRPALSGSPLALPKWLPDGEHYLQSQQGRLAKVHALSGRSTPMVETKGLVSGLAKLPGFNQAKARGAMGRPGQTTFNSDQTAAVVEHARDLYYATTDGKTARRLTSTPEAEELVSFSPDGKWIAFVRTKNLHVVDVNTGTERALTTDGGGLITNGQNDWVYYEEIFNRDWQCYWWSPDSQHLAYLRLDDTPLREFTVLDHLPVHQREERTRYPKAGDPNPLVAVGVVAVDGATPVMLNLKDYDPTQILVSRVGWSGDGKKVYAYIQNRQQTWLDVVTASPNDSTCERLLRETTKAWVNDLGPLRFLKDGSLLFASERTGYKHIYHLKTTTSDKATATNVNALTSGDWEIRDILLVDEKANQVYFTAMEDNPIGENLYRVSLDGKKLDRLTVGPAPDGTHAVAVSPNGKYFISSWSNSRTPTQTRLYSTDLALTQPLRVLDSNPVHALDEFAIRYPEKHRIKTPDGFEMEAWLTMPAAEKEGKKTPVPAWILTYAGPAYPSVKDGFSSAGLVRDTAMAEAGIATLRVDPRSASGKGAVMAWSAYRQLGVGELADLEIAADWLAKRGDIDPKRIGLSGHSYGGFITAFALTHSTKFAAGISGAPVTDWRNYDSIYTERYMSTPQENPQGYERTSVVKAAAKLHGRLLLLHGIMDDNVHVQNAVQFVDALQRANKDFVVMFYPRARHGIFGEHYQRIMIEFTFETMLGRKP